MTLYLVIALLTMFCLILYFTKNRFLITEFLMMFFLHFFLFQIVLTIVSSKKCVNVFFIMGIVIIILHYILLLTIYTFREKIKINLCVKLVNFSNCFVSTAYLCYWADFISCFTKSEQIITCLFFIIVCLITYKYSNLKKV